MPRPVTILCANLKGNLGDYAILEIMGWHLSKRFPDVETRFFYHANKPVDEKRYARFLQELAIDMRDLGPAPFFPRPTWFRLLSKLPGTRSLMVHLHNGLIGRVAEKLGAERAFAAALEESALVLFAGGSQWGKANLNLNMFAQLACAHDRGRRVAAFPFGISKVALDCNGPSRLSRMLSQLSQPIAVRDVISHRLLRGAGLQTTHVSDCVFTASQLFAELRESPPARTRKVYVSVTRSGKTTAHDLAGLCQALRDAGQEPVLFSSCEIEDRPLIDAVLAISDEAYIAPDSWKAAVNLFAEAAFVITNRLHCLIFSALAGCAVVPVANRQKAEAYAEDAGLDYAPRGIAAITSESLSAYVETLDDVRRKQLAFLDKSAATTAAVIDEICALADVNA